MYHLHVSPEVAHGLSDYKELIACEGSRMKIACPVGFVINVRRAMYGREKKLLVTLITSVTLVTLMT